MARHQDALRELVARDAVQAGGVEALLGVTVHGTYTGNGMYAPAPASVGTGHQGD